MITEHSLSLYVIHFYYVHVCHYYYIIICYLLLHHHFLHIISTSHYCSITTAPPSRSEGKLQQNSGFRNSLLPLPYDGSYFVLDVLGGPPFHRKCPKKVSSLPRRYLLLAVDGGFKIVSDPILLRFREEQPLLHSRCCLGGKQLPVDYCVGLE